MFCPKCKNPTDDNATVCEWCGISIVTQNTSKSEISELDVELLALLENGEKRQAVKHYKEKTGEPNIYISSLHVARLEFFKTHKFATEDLWNREWQHRMGKRVGFRFVFLIIISSMAIPIGMVSNIVFYGHRGLDHFITIGIMLPIGIFLISYFWKKMKIMRYI